MVEPQLKTEQEVLARFQEMRQNISTLWNKLADLDTEAAEHDVVIKQLEPMDKGRKCYRMIGDVLVERTVAETLPAVIRNREGLGAVMQQYKQQLEQQQKALAAFQEKYKIRVAQAGEEEQGGGSSSKTQAAAAAGSSSSKGATGVLC